MKLNKNHLISIILSIIILFEGCTRTIDITKSQKYQNQSVIIATSDEVQYKLGSGWKIDSTNSVSGLGVKITKDSTFTFKGKIDNSRIQEASIIDSETPAIVLGTFALGALGYIWYEMAQPKVKK